MVVEVPKVDFKRIDIVVDKHVTTEKSGSDPDEFKVVLTHVNPVDPEVAITLRAQDEAIYSLYPLNARFTMIIKPDEQSKLNK